MPHSQHLCQAFIAISVFWVQQAQGQSFFASPSERVAVAQQTSIDNVGPDANVQDTHGSTAVSEELPAPLQEATKR
jgi:hypothetical protein